MFMRKGLGMTFLYLYLNKARKQVQPAELKPTPPYSIYPTLPVLLFLRNRPTAPKDAYAYGSKQQGKSH